MVIISAQLEASCDGGGKEPGPSFAASLLDPLGEISHDVEGDCGAWSLEQLVGEINRSSDQQLPAAGRSLQIKSVSSERDRSLPITQEGDTYLKMS